MKKFIVFFFFFLFLTPGVYAKEKPQVLFINQVRGEECCGKGSLPNLKLQVDALKNYQIPAYFTLRYDVLTNNAYVDYLKEEIKEVSEIVKLGLLVEVTPQLAKSAQVFYHGRESQWYEAQNIFTIGYQVSDRKKLLDRLFSTFKDKFGFYPTLTSSWLIDTDSLNYIHEKYGVAAHQITREQWGTDSYTLYGGPAHYPYLGSRSWAFIPDFDNENAVLMLRQTVSDPLYNYGDTTSSFTSQPNDYLNANLDLEYFKKLVNQALFEQKTTGFALLGLENSNDENYQDEFVRQIEYINELKNRIVFPDLKQLSQYWLKQKTTFYSGKDLIHSTDNQVEFITTPDHRQRLRKTNGQTSTTDYRYYNKDLADPYNNYVAKKNGYWIVPYALDYSHVYKPETIFPETRNDLIINKQKGFKIKKINAKRFNQTRLKNYPYFLPEPIEREISPRKTKLKITANEKITLDLKVKDQYGYPDVISSPVEIKTDPPVEGIDHKINGERHLFSFKNPGSFFLVINISSNKKTIKTVFLFPKFSRFFKLIL